MTSHVFVRASCQPRVDIDTGSAESSLTSHTFARRSFRPEPERCRFLVDVAQKSSKKFCREGGKWWQVGIGRRYGWGWALLRRMQKLSEFVKSVSSRPAPFGGGGFKRLPPIPPTPFCNSGVRHLGEFLKHLGGSLVRFLGNVGLLGGLGGHSWGVFGAMSGVLGPSWTALGFSWGSWGPLWESWGSCWASRVLSGGFGVAFWMVAGASWAQKLASRRGAVLFYRFALTGVCASSWGLRGRGGEVAFGGRGVARGG